MSNNPVFKSMVRMDDSRTQVKNIKVVFSSEKKLFTEDNTPKVTQVEKRLRNSLNRRPYKVVE